MKQLTFKTFFLALIVCFMPMVLAASSPAPAGGMSYSIQVVSKKHAWKDTYHRLEQNMGRRLSLQEKIALRIIGKKQVSTLNMPKQVKAAKYFSFGGFCLGFFLGLIGVLIAYIIDSDIAGSAWKGLGVAALLILVAVAIIVLSAGTTV